jgi:LmbE family N-acetylglucosaminyl deacetylase
MKGLELVRPGKRLKLLCLGAHADDIEIGAGGAILSWIAAGAKLDVSWCVLSAAGDRAEEAKASASAFLEGAERATIELGEFRDSYFPHQGAAVKEWVQALKERVQPDLILTHAHTDAHQDHRLVNELAWNAFRDHLILEFEIPKWDGDLGRPNCYVPIAPEILARKIALLEEHFGSQRAKAWFDKETFTGLARVRGMECRARYAEAFYGRKLVLG